MDPMIDNLDAAIRERVEARAQQEGLTIGSVVSRLLERYASGEIDAVARFATREEFEAAADRAMAEYDEALRLLAK
jgi:hypothetical protein